VRDCLALRGYRRWHLGAAVTVAVAIINRRAVQDRKGFVHHPNERYVQVEISIMHTLIMHKSDNA